MTNSRETRHTAATDAIRAVFNPDVAEAIVTDEAFGALAQHLHWAEQDGADPTEVLAAVDPDDRDFAGRADHPAAFLASRIAY